MTRWQVIDHLANRVAVLAGEDNAAFASQADRRNGIHRAGQIEIRMLNAVMLEVVDDDPGVWVIKQGL